MAVDFVIDEGGMAELLRSFDSPIARDLMRRGQSVEATAKRLAHEPGTGVTYLRHGVSHTASAPGQPFATDTGELAASITHQLGEDAEGLYVRVGSSLEVMRYMELGTSHIEARPTLRPAIRSAAL